MTPTGWVALLVEEALMDDVSLAQALQDAVEVVATEHREAFVDSHLIGRVVSTHRINRLYMTDCEANHRQTLDYVQHLLREAYHVCRYADNEGVYFAHIERECTPKCREHAHRFKEPSRGHCQHCFLELTTTNHCPGGCDDD